MTLDETTSPPAPVGTGRAAALRSVARRVPFTTSLFLLVLVVGLVTQTLWNGLEYRPLYHDVAYGLPAFEDGRWWTVVTGPLFALVPLQYLSILLALVVFVGTCELVLGTRRAVIAFVAGQLFAVLGAALLLWVLSGTTDWGWADRIAARVDVGLVSGSLCAIGAATAKIRAPWDTRIRMFLIAYVGISLLYIGVLWDVEHALGLALGLAIGPALAGRPTLWRRPRIARREWRILAASVFLIAAVTRVLLWYVPADGPLGATSDDDDVWGVWLTSGISLLFAWGLLKGRRVAWRWAMGFTVVVSVLLLAAVVLSLSIPEEVDATIDTGQVPAFLVSILLWLLQLGILFFGRSAFTSPTRRRMRKLGSLTGDERGVAVDVLHRDGGTALSWMTTWEHNQWYVPPAPDGTPAGFVAYQLHQGTAVALGDAVGPDLTSRLGILDSYVGFWEQQGVVPCLFSVTQETADWAHARGWQLVQVADEAVIDLPDLEFKGKAWQDIRTALNRAGKEGVQYRSGRLAEMPRGIIQQVRAISQDWVGDKSLPEMGFTLGGVEEALDPEVMVGLAVDTDGTVHGVTSWLPVYGPSATVHAWTLDVMRRLPDGFRPTTEFLIASACLEFQAAGYEYVSLSGAPLAHSPGEDDDPTALDQLLAWLGNTLEPVYGFRSLESFKAKFKPRHRPLYLVFQDEAQLPRIGLALTRAYVPDASLRELAAAGIKARRG